MNRPNFPGCSWIAAIAGGQQARKYPDFTRVSKALVDVGGLKFGAGASLDEISVEAKALREALHKGLARLQKMRGQRGNEPAYRTIRAAIRAHIVKQIEAEGELVAPAFSDEDLDGKLAWNEM